MSLLTHRPRRESRRLGLGGGGARAEKPLIGLDTRGWERDLHICAEPEELCVFFFSLLAKLKSSIAKLPTFHKNLFLCELFIAVLAVVYEIQKQPVR